MKTTHSIETTTNAFPDGEGLNALPIAFVWDMRIEHNALQSEHIHSALRLHSFPSLRAAQTLTRGDS